MIEPLADGEESRFLKRLSPNGTEDDYVEVWLTRVGIHQKIELRQMRPAPRRSGEEEKERSMYITLRNFDELVELHAGEEITWPSAES